MGDYKFPTPFKLRHKDDDAIASLERCFDIPPENWDFTVWRDAEDLPEDGREKICSLLAELAFWQRIACPNQPTQLPDWLLATRPFADAENNLQELLPLASQAVMATFPLAGQNEQPPALARLYLLEEKLVKDSRHRLSFADSISQDHTMLVSGCQVCSKEKIDGDSWQLAAELAQSALAITDLRLPLGMSWICTGAVDRRGTVKAVQIGNKTQLTAKSTRRWLLPDGENFADWRRAGDPDAHGFAVRTLTEAVTYIRESGIVPYQFVFPEKIDELHILLGETLPPVLAVCMQLLPRCLCLWYSEQTQAHAAALQQVLEKLISVELHFVPSDNMAAVEVRIRERLSENAELARLINITGGNRMMGFAAMLAARHCRVQIVYRDIDAENEQLEMIDFADDPKMLPRNGKIKGNNCPDKWKKMIAWKTLYNRPVKTAARAKPDPAWLRKILWKDEKQTAF